MSAALPGSPSPPPAPGAPAEEAPRPLAAVGLEGWTVQRAATLPSAKPLWSDGLGTSSHRVADGGDALLLRTASLAAAVISSSTRRIRLADLGGGPALADQWLADQVAPRLLSHLGQLVVHAAAVRTAGGGAALLVGPSRQGKSTLAAFLSREGWPLLGDDAAVIRSEDRVVRSVYPRLRLRRDSWRRFHSGAAAEPGGTIGLPSGATPTMAPLAALFALAEGPDCRVDPLSPAAACMELVRNAYALDPTDRDRAALRLSQCAAVANTVPAFRLSYPRDYARLPELRDVLLGALAQARP